MVPHDRIVVTGEGVTLERMLWKRDRRYTTGLCELALDINPGLAGFGAVIPVGTAVRLPLVSALVSAATV